MAGREKKQLGNKQPMVRKETEKVTRGTGTELQKQDDVTSKTKVSKQKVQKDVNSRRKPTLTTISTGIKKTRSLTSKEIVVKDNSSGDSEANTKRKQQGNTRSCQLLKVKQSGKIGKKIISQGLSDLVEDSPLQLLNDSKSSLGHRLSRTNKSAKQEIKTSEEANLNCDSAPIAQGTKSQNTKLGSRRLSKLNKLGAASTELRNGTKGRNTHYVTRSDSPARILRNGKRRKDPNLLEGLDLGYPKRRRLLSITRDGSGSELGSKSEPILDDQSSIADSDISFNDSPRLENGRGNWDSDCESKAIVEESKCEVMLGETQSSVTQSENLTDSCLGKSISNKIAELINRNKFLESVQKEVVSKQDESLGNIVTSKCVESKEISNCKVADKEKGLTDTNSNVCNSESIPSKKSEVACTEEFTSSTDNVISENRSPGTAEKVPFASSFKLSKKVNSQDLKELDHKNGQNLSIDLNFTEKFPRKIRDLKVIKPKPPRLFQALHSTSGMFYVVQNTTTSPFQKEGTNSTATSCSGGRRASVDVHVVNTDMMKSDSSAASVQSVNTADIHNVQTKLQLEESSTENIVVVDHTEGACSSEKKLDVVISETVDVRPNLNSIIKHDDKGVSMGTKIESPGNFENNNNNCLTGSDNREDSTCEIKSSVDSLISSDSKENVGDNVDVCDNAALVVDCKTDSNATSVSVNEDCKFAISSECFSNKVKDTIKAVSFDNSDCIEESDVKTKESANTLCLNIKQNLDSVEHINADSKNGFSSAGCQDNTGNIVSNNISENANSIEVGTARIDENVNNVDEKIKCYSIDNSLPIATSSTDISEQLVKTVSEQVLPGYESDSSIKSVRRSSRSSLDKTRAAVRNCLKSKRTRSKKQSVLGKNQDVDKDESESQSSCITEDDSTVDSADIILTEKLKNDCKDIQAGSVKIDNKSVEEIKIEMKDVKSIGDETELTNSVDNITSKSSINTDVEIDQNENKKVDIEEKINTNDENEEIQSSGIAPIDVKHHEPVKVCAEDVLLKHQQLNIPGSDIDSYAASDITDFTIVDSTNSIGSISDAGIEPLKKEENESVSITESRQENETIIYEEKSSLKNKEPSPENITDKLTEDENNLSDRKSCKSQIGIEPALFYSKESPKNKFSDVKITSEEVIFSCMEGKIPAENTSVPFDCIEGKIPAENTSVSFDCIEDEIPAENTSVSFDCVKGKIPAKNTSVSFDCVEDKIPAENTSVSFETECAKNHYSESECDMKNDCSQNKSDYEDKLVEEKVLEVKTGSIVCSDEVEEADNKSSFCTDIFQDKVDQDVKQESYSIAEMSLICSDDSRIQEEVKESEIGELHQESSCAENQPLEINLESSESESKTTNERSIIEEEVSPEEQAIKESVLSALGLQPLRVSQAGASVSCERSTFSSSSNYTGTLKTVIKLQRSSPEKRRTSLKLVLKHGKARSSMDGVDDKDEEDYEELSMEGDEIVKYSICKETDLSESSKDNFAFGAGSRKGMKTPSYRYFDISSKPQIISEKTYSSDQQTSDPKDDKGSGTKQNTNLVIPEKSSSFSIHPGRLCNDVCSYCFGKFGSLDTPCHIAQLKSHERQRKVLEMETHLTADSCLCDACYRHVDRKANCPSYKPNKKRQYHRTSSSQIKTQCCVQGCTQTAHNHVRRKWLIKLKRSIAKKVPIDMEKMPQQVPFPLCPKHFSWVDYYMVCGICKRRLTRNHMFPLGPEVHELNTALANDGIPVRLSDKLFLCKLCRYFASVLLKYKDPSQLAANHKSFFQGYRKRILHSHDIEEADGEIIDEIPPKPKRRKTKTPSSTIVKMDGEDGSGTKSTCEQSEDQALSEALSPSAVDRSGASTPMIDYSSLGGAFDDNTSHKQGLKLDHVKPPKIKLKLGNVSKNGHLSSSPEDHSTTRSILLPERDGLEVTPLPDSIGRPFYPGEDQLPLHATFDFHTKKEHSEENKRKDWEKCSATIQFDKETKNLFQHLQRPYGNHSSFFRHLILLEKYWRSGELMLSPSASSRATTYVNSVQNRIHAYEGRPSSFFPSYGATLTTAKPVTSTVTTQATPVPIIDLPLKRRLGGGILTATDGPSKPVTITSLPSVSVSPQPVSFTPITASVITPCHSRISAYTTFQRNPSSPSPRKVLVDATSTGSHIQASRRLPNVLQVMAGGKSFSIVPGLSQIRQIHSVHQHHYQKQQMQHQQSSTFEPMICDVRSLASENGSGLWNQSSSQNSSKILSSNTPVTLLPKTSTSLHSSGVAVKPSTIVTPTGIILSRKPEISVTAVMEKRDVALRPKVISSKKESISKLKALTEKVDIVKAKAVLEKKDDVLQTTVPELKDGLSNTKC